MMRSPAAGAGSERRADTHDARAEPSPHQLIHQRRGQRCVGPQEPGEVLVLSQVFPHRQSWRSRCQTRGLAAPAPPAPGAHPSADSHCPGAGAGRAGAGRSCAGAAARGRGAGPAGLRSGGGRGCDKGHGVGSETPALPRSAPRLPSPAAHMEPSKLPTTPGASPAVGCRKQGLFMLQMMPCSQGRVPAEGSALLGKWPEGEGGRFRGTVQDPRDPTYTPVSPHPVTISRVCPPGVTPKGSRTGAHRGVLAGSGGPAGDSHSCCLKGGWDRRTEIKIRKRKRGHRISIASWIWGRRKVGGGPGPHQCPQPCARNQRLWVAPLQSPTHPLPPTVGEVLPEQQPQLGAHGHCEDRGPRSAPAAGESRGGSPKLRATAGLSLPSASGFITPRAQCRAQG